MEQDELEALVPAGRRFWVMPEMIRLDRKGLPEPALNVHETARLMFASSSSWLRQKMRPDPEHKYTWLVAPDGKPMEIMRKNPDKPESARVFRLSDVEPMAWSLHRFEMDEIQAARRQLDREEPAELAGLCSKQDSIMAARGNTDRQRARLAGAHANQRAKLGAKFAQARRRQDQRECALRNRLAATIEIVKGEARLWGILDAAGDPVPRG